MSGEHGLSPSRVLLLSVFCAVGASALTTLALQGAFGDRAGDSSDVRLGRREATAVHERGVGAGSPGDAEAIAKLEDSVARIERALEEEGVPLDGNAAGRKDEVLAGLLGITQAERQLAVREAFQELVKCGDAAVPDILALLKSGRDQDYGGGYSFGGNMFTGGYPRLRTVLIDVLRQIGTPAAKEALLDALRGSEDLLDYRDLLLMYSSSTDEQMVQGISTMIPEILAKVASGGEGADQLDWSMSNWLGKHKPEGIEDLLEKLAVTALRDDTRDRGALAALIDIAPERAFLVVARQTENPQQALRRVTSSLRMRRANVSLSSVARFGELVLSKLDLDDPARASLYMSLPSRLDRSIASPAARAADGKVLLEFLARRQRVETAEMARQIIERAIGSLKKQIAKIEQH